MRLERVDSESKGIGRIRVQSAHHAAAGEPEAERRGGRRVQPQQRRVARRRRRVREREVRRLGVALALGSDRVFRGDPPLGRLAQRRGERGVGEEGLRLWKAMEARRRSAAGRW